MCGPSGGGTSDATAFAQQQAMEARAREEERAARIRQGQEQINRLFDYGEVLVPTGRTIQVENPEWAAYVARFGDPSRAALYQTAIGAITALTPGVNSAGIPASQRFIDTPETVWQRAHNPFDQAFYDRYRQAYLDYYMPQLQRQYEDARRETQFALARAGITRSTAAGRKMEELTRRFGEEQGGLAIKAEEGVNRLRSDVENERANLLMQLETATDPEAMANTALARASALAQRPVDYSPLGDIFAGFAEGVGGFTRGLRERRILDAVSAASRTPSAAGVKGAARIVG